MLLADAHAALLMLLAAPRAVVADAVHVELDAQGSNIAVVAPVVDLQCKYKFNFSLFFLQHNDAVSKLANCPR